MKNIRPTLPLPVLAVAVAFALTGCGPRPGDSQEEPAWTPTRTTHVETITGAIQAMEREDYSGFPTIMGLTYHLFVLHHGGARDESEAMTEEDFARTLRFLRELRGVKPRLTRGGNLAVFKMPGYQLPGDNFQMIQYGGKWYFLVD